MTEPNIHDLARQVAVLEERMNTSYERLRADMADFRADQARRDVWMVLAVMGIVSAALAVHGWVTVTLGQ